MTNKIPIREFFKDKFHQIIDFLNWDQGTYEGRAFDTLCAGGIKEQGKPAETYLIESVTDAYLEALEKYLKERIEPGKKYTLVWRRTPEIDTCPDNRFIITSRLLLTEELDLENDQ